MNLEVSPDTRIEAEGPDSGTKGVGPDNAIEEVCLHLGDEEVDSDRGNEKEGPNIRTEDVRPDTSIEERNDLLRHVGIIFSRVNLIETNFSE